MIKQIESSSVHRITSGQVVIDLQTAVKELVENSLDAGAGTIEVKFKDNGLKSIEVIDNGCGISPEDYENVALNHFTSKISSFASLSTLTTFGFRGEALSSLCALAEKVVIVTATKNEAPMGTVLSFDRIGRIVKVEKSARQRGTSVQIHNLFTPLPVRRKEFSRNAKRELGKALNLLTAYALVPCTQENKGVKLVVTSVTEKGQKSSLLRTDGSPSLRASISSLWGPKQLESLVELKLDIKVVPEKMVLKRRKNTGISTIATHKENEVEDEEEDTKLDDASIKLHVKGLISKFAPGCGRSGTDRQFFFINGRPCSPSKVQKAVNEVYRTFNTNQSPFVVADFILPPDSYDVNVSPDKRTILLHSENNLITALKEALEKAFSASRSTYTVQVQSTLTTSTTTQQRKETRSIQAAANAIEAERSEDNDVDTRNSPRSFGEQHLLLRSRESDSQMSGSSVSARKSEQSSQENENSEQKQSHQTDEEALFLPEVIAETNGSGFGMTEVEEDVNMEEAEPTSLSGNNAPREEVEISLLQDAIQPPRAASPITNSVTPPPIVVSSRSPSPVVMTSHPTRPSLDKNSSNSSAGASRLRSVQLTLDTTNASWNLKENTSSTLEDEPPRKKARTSDADRTGHWSGRTSIGEKSESKNSREKFSMTLTQFARPGSSVSKCQQERLEEDTTVVGGESEHEEADSQDDEEDQLDMIQDDSEIATQEQEQRSQDDIVEKQKGVARENKILTPMAKSAESLEPLNNDLRDSADISFDGPAMQEPILIDENEDELTTERHMHLQELNTDSQDMSAESSSFNVDYESTPSSLLTSSMDSSSNIEVVRTVDDEDDDVSVQFDLSRVVKTCTDFSQSARAESARNENTSISSRSKLGSNASVANTSDNSSAVSELSRIIHKEDFGRMQILGQFNLGFIIARRIESRMDNAEYDAGVDDMVDQLDDLFIIDQHAADEKYNFETLQQTTKIESQRLFKPLALELTAADELVAIENLDALRFNGFDISIDDEDLVGSRTQQHGRVKLVSQPVSGNTDFTVKDLEELLHLLRDRPSGQTVRCSKARAMFASRACRKSVMIGTALNKSQMTSIVRHMGTMEQPWNCPHGRPTMRHLVSILDHVKTAGAESTRTRRDINWDDL